MTEWIYKTFGVDKVLHFTVGGWLCAIMSLVFLIQEGLTGWNTLLSVVLGTIVVVILSLMKELVLDADFCWKDILAALIGCATIALAVAVGVLFGIGSAC